LTVSNRRFAFLEAGTTGEMALCDGNSFEYASHVTAVMIEGQVLSETVR